MRFPQDERGEENCDCFVKIRSENMKMTWNIRFFIFYMIYNFSKCDGFTVLQMISIKQCDIKFIASPLQPW